MGFVQTYRQSTGGGGGGGGLAITGWRNQIFTQTSAFVSGLSLTLAQTPLTPESLTLDYNGQRLNATEWSLTGSTITILFSDLDVASYDEPPTFQANYPF